MSLYKSDKARKGQLPLYQYWYRKINSTTTPAFLKPILKVIYRVISHSYCCEIPYTVQIGEGLYIGHPYNITLNPKVKIGKNCNIHKGLTIGQENRGKRKGVPVIGNEVWIGVNVTIVGNITIGDDVLIAPNSFVNCDVPSHSIVFGNPCQIKTKINATENYINNKV